MKVAAVVSTKGGPGKTTVGANLGAFCADAGVRTLLIDLDNQPSLSSFYNLSHEAPGGTYQLITSNECSQLVSSLILLATEQVLAQAERYPFTLLPIRMTRQSTGAGTVFLRWSRMDRSKMGVDLWAELILDDRTPVSLVSELLAMELQRIMINMQISGNRPANPLS